MTKDTKFDLKDIAIIPSFQSSINSRSECDTNVKFHGSDFLPLMAAPMDTVVCNKNTGALVYNGIIPCHPRNSAPNDYSTVYSFKSVGLKEIEIELERYFNDPLEVNNKSSFFDAPNILIDVANGHMLRVIHVVKKIKRYFPKIKLMVGNIAHPFTYQLLSEAGADFVRCSIGTGAGCTTAANVAINYPIGSLISECYEIKQRHGLETKIVADGGMQGYDDIIKALALGADFVMIGSLFNKAMQSAGFNYLWGIKLNYHIAKTLWKWGFPIMKKYRGMSTKEVQRSWGRTRLVTAEGITKYQKVEYNLGQWVDNFKDYLKSNMSYCDAKTLDEFIGKVDWVYISGMARKRFEK